MNVLRFLEGVLCAVHIFSLDPGVIGPSHSTISSGLTVLWLTTEILAKFSRRRKANVELSKEVSSAPSRGYAEDLSPALTDPDIGYLLSTPLDPVIGYSVSALDSAALDSEAAVFSCWSWEADASTGRAASPEHLSSSLGSAKNSLYGHESGSSSGSLRSLESVRVTVGYFALLFKFEVDRIAQNKRGREHGQLPVTLELWKHWVKTCFPSGLPQPPNSWCQEWPRVWHNDADDVTEVWNFDIPFATPHASTRNFPTPRGFIEDVYPSRYVHTRLVDKSPRRPDRHAESPIEDGTIRSGRRIPHGPTGLAHHAWQLDGSVRYTYGASLRTITEERDGTDQLSMVGSSDRSTRSAGSLSLLVGMESSITCCSLSSAGSSLPAPQLDRSCPHCTCSAFGRGHQATWSSLSSERDAVNSDSEVPVASAGTSASARERRESLTSDSGYEDFLTLDNTRRWPSVALSTASSCPCALDSLAV